MNREQIKALDTPETDKAEFYSNVFAKDMRSLERRYRALMEVSQQALAGIVLSKETFEKRMLALDETLAACREIERGN